MTDKRKIHIAVPVMLLLTALLILTGCSPKVITVPEYHHEYHHTTDTVTKTDSVLKEKETIIREADSAMVAELGLRLKDRERAILILRKELERVMNARTESRTDTIVKVDSIRVPYPVEKPLSWWQQQKIRWGETAMAALLVVLLIVCIRRYKKK